MSVIQVTFGEYIRVWYALFGELDRAEITVETEFSSTVIPITRMSSEALGVFGVSGIERIVIEPALFIEKPAVQELLPFDDFEPDENYNEVQR